MEDRIENRNHSQCQKGGKQQADDEAPITGDAYSNVDMDKDNKTWFFSRDKRDFYASASFLDMTLLLWKESVQIL